MFAGRVEVRGSGLTAEGAASGSPSGCPANSSSEGDGDEAGTGLHRRDAGVEERRRAPNRRGHRAPVPGVRKAVKWNSPFYGAEGQAGWFLNFSCLTKYIKVAFVQGTLLDRATASRRSTKSGTSTSSKTTTWMSGSSPPG